MKIEQLKKEIREKLKDLSSKLDRFFAKNGEEIMEQLRGEYNALKLVLEKLENEN